MSIHEFVAQNQGVKPGADIAERWHNRIVAEGMVAKGALGAAQYLGKYGKGLRAPKAIALARMAEVQGALAMAARFWEEAFFLQTGTREKISPSNEAVPATAAAFTAPGVRATCGFRPQLPIVITREEAEALLENPAWGVQEKEDGENLSLTIGETEVTPGNKQGLVSDRTPVEICEAIAPLRQSLVHGEKMPTGVFKAFDLLRHAGVCLKNAPYIVRQARLAKVLPKSPLLECIPFVAGPTFAKRRFFEELEASGAEGAVFKLLEGRYAEGEQHETMYKFQFRARASVVVLTAPKDKRSVEVGVSRADGTVRNLGSVTVKANLAVPQIASVVEVRYLYVHLGAEGKFAQAEMLGPRVDVEAADCREDKLRFKGKSRRTVEKCMAGRAG